MSGSIGGVDATIPLQAGRGVTQNPLTSNPAQFANTLNSFNQLKMFPLQMQHQQLANQGQSISNQGAELQQNLVRLNAGVGHMLPLLLNQDGTPTTGVSAKDIARGLADASDPNSGILTAKQAAGMLQTLPDGGADPAKNRQWLLQMYAQNRSAAGQAEAAIQQLGLSPATRDNGQSIVSGGVSGPLSNAPGAFVQAGAPTQVYPTRAQTVQPTTYPGPGGAPIQTTVGGYAAAHGASADLGPGGGAAPPGYTGRYPAPPQLPSVPGVPPGATVGPAPGTVEAGGVTGQANAQQAIGLQQAAAGVPQQKALLGNLDAALGQFTSGGGADWKNVAKTFVNANNPFGDTFDVSRIASQDEFNKQAIQLAQQQFQTLGGTGTDAKLNSTMHTSPNTALSNLSNKSIIGLLKGNADAIAVMNDEWQNHWLPAHDGNTATYGQFVTQFNKQFDPRVFQGMYMDPQDRQHMLSGMSAREKDQFRQDFNLAVRNGWIPDPRNSQAPSQTAAPQVPTN